MNFYDNKINEVSISDVSGKIVLFKKNNLSLIDLSYLQNGIYFISITTENLTIKSKIIKN